MDNMIKIEMSKDDAEELKSLLLEKISFIDDQIKNYSNIISNYLCNFNYEYKGCTLKQAMNCGQHLGEDINKYIQD